MNKQPVLSICIPTYNREQRLLSLLKSIFLQKGSENIRVSVIDNHSDYDVAASVSRAFPDRVSQITVTRNKINVGGDANIAMLFFHCDTPWMWMLGDDDECMPDSISNILSDISEYPDITMFKYSIEGFLPHENKEICSITEFVDYFWPGDHKSGDMIFISNNVYNTSKAREYYKTTLMNCSCAISQLLPALFALEEKIEKIMLRPTSIVKYLPPAPGSEWNLLKTAIRIVNVADIFPSTPLNITHKLSYLVVRDFGHLNLSKICLKYSDRSYSKYYYKSLYCKAFKYAPSIKDRIICILFYLSYHLKFDFLSTAERIHSYKSFITKK